MWLISACDQGEATREAGGERDVKDAGEAGEAPPPLSAGSGDGGVMELTPSDAS